ncbi:MAG: cell division protein FtsQ [Hyphomicrobiales bacterium]|nr:MAG: cell division protein FtsQ [Hyphomicrobiales bacterium]
MPKGRGRARTLSTAVLFGRELPEPPRFTGTVLALGFLGCWGAYALALGGQLAPVAETLSSSAGFGIDAVRITGQKEIAEADVLTVLDIEPGTSLLSYDAADARVRLSHMSWVNAVSVRKLYPATLQVTIKEREPFALWQRGQTVSVVDRAGEIITDVVDDRFVRLPLAIGHGAQRRLAEFMTTMDRFTTLKPKVRAYILVSDRRWTLRLDNGIDVLLPEADTASALERLERLDNEGGLLARDLAAIDLRFDDRVMVRLTQAAQERRKAELDSGKSKKKGARI